MALSADEERAFAELAAALTTQPRQAGPRPQSRAVLVFVALCVLLAACVTTSRWL